MFLSCVSNSTKQQRDVDRLTEELRTANEKLHNQQVFLDQYVLSTKSVETICGGVRRPVWMTEAGETEHVRLIVEHLRQVLSHEKGE